MIYWEDVVLDAPRESAERYLLTVENIKAFAAEWDPFSPHVDEAVAAKSPIGQLFAAGVHLLSVTIRLSHTIPSGETASIAGRGWDKLRFHRPGVTGDELRARVTHVERGPGSRPERGVLVSRFELLNQHDELVISFDAHVVMLRREPLAA